MVRVPMLGTQTLGTQTLGTETLGTETLGTQAFAATLPSIREVLTWLD